MQTAQHAEGYVSILSDKLENERAIDLVKSTFTQELSQRLNLIKVTAPIAVDMNTGLNDDLNGIERPVSFSIKCMNDHKAVIVHSLAKWKRMRLGQLNAEPGIGILTDMKALRPDEDLGPIHSLYVDQWDWERAISRDQRELPFLKSVVEEIYAALKTTEKTVNQVFPQIKPTLPESITFIQSQDLLNKYPNMNAKERETAAAKEFGAVFLMGIGGELSNGEPHDGRAPDYDDWSTQSSPGYYGLNGDILVWNPVTQSAFELSSMGIRVDEASLLKQLAIRGCPERKGFPFHDQLLKGELPQSIGGGIGQSRVCMFMLRKRHIGEVQASIWPQSMIDQCKLEGIELI